MVITTTFNNTKKFVKLPNREVLVILTLTLTKSIEKKNISINTELKILLKYSKQIKNDTLYYYYLQFLQTHLGILVVNIIQIATKFPQTHLGNFSQIIIIKNEFY